MKRRRLNAKTNLGDQPVSAICQAGGAGPAITQAVVVKTEHVEHPPKHAAAATESAFVGDQPSPVDKLDTVIRGLGADDCHKVLLNGALPPPLPPPLPPTKPLGSPMFRNACIMEAFCKI